MVWWSGAKSEATRSAIAPYKAGLWTAEGDGFTCHAVVETLLHSCLRDLNPRRCYPVRLGRHSAEGWLRNPRSEDELIRVCETSGHG